MSKETQSSNANLKRANAELTTEKQQLEYEHQELRKSDTHHELAELKDKLKEDKESHDAHTKELDDELERRQHRINELNSMVKMLQEQNQQLQAEALETLQGGGKTVPAEMSKDIHKKIKIWVQTVACQKWKFVMDPLMRKCTDECCDDIAGGLGIDNNHDPEYQEFYMTKTDFHRIHRAYFKEVISGKRQATSSQMMKVCQGTCHSHVQDMSTQKLRVTYPLLLPCLPFIWATLTLYSWFAETKVSTKYPKHSKRLP